MEKVNNETVSFGAANSFPEDYGVKMEYKLPESFLFGVSYSADQTEGGDLDSSWNDWYKRGKIKDGSDPATCVDHWERWKEDADLMKELGVSRNTAMRFATQLPCLYPTGVRRYDIRDVARAIESTRRNP